MEDIYKTEVKISKLIAKNNSYHDCMVFSYIKNDSDQIFCYINYVPEISQKICNGLTKFNVRKISTKKFGFLIG